MLTIAVAPTSSQTDAVGAAFGAGTDLGEALIWRIGYEALPLKGQAQQ